MIVPRRKLGVAAVHDRFMTANSASVLAHQTGGFLEAVAWPIRTPFARFAKKNFCLASGFRLQKPLFINRELILVLTGFIRMALTQSTPTVFTVQEVAEILRLGKISVYQAIARGDIPYVRIGRRILIPRHALEQRLTCFVAASTPAA